VANEIQAALIGVFGAIGGVWYGARLSRQAAQDLLAQQAKAEFAASFTDTLTKLHAGAFSPGQADALFIMQEAYPAHFAAYLKLRSIVPKKQQDAIDQAWQQYTQDDQFELAEEKSTYRFSHILNADTDKHQQMLAIKHINSLLDAIAT